MASTVTIPTNTDGRHDDTRSLKRRIRLLTPVGNYATNGETITAQQFGMKRFVAINLLNGSVAAASTPTTAEGVGFIVSASGTSAVMRFYESGAANAALAEKSNAEAPPTGQTVLVEAIGY
jgi:hypothetical protein